MVPENRCVINIVGDDHPICLVRDGEREGDYHASVDMPVACAQLEADNDCVHISRHPVCELDSARIHVPASYRRGDVCPGQVVLDAKVDAVYVDQVAPGTEVQFSESTRLAKRAKRYILSSTTCHYCPAG